MNRNTRPRVGITIVASLAALLAGHLPIESAGASTIVFADDFDNATNGSNQAITFADLSPAVGSWAAQSTGVGINDHDDLGEVVGNAVGVASSNNALLIDNNEDDDGPGPDTLGNNGNTILQGNFTQAFDLTNPNTSFTFSWDWYGTRLAGNTNNNERNMRLSLNEGGARAFVVVMELHTGNAIDIVMRDSNDGFDDAVVLTVPRPTSNRLDGDYDPLFNTHMELNIDTGGQLTVTATAPGGATNTVAGLWNNGTNTAPASLDNFELFLGGTTSGNKGGTFDNFVATVVPEPNSCLLLTGVSLAGIAVRLRRKWQTRYEGATGSEA